MLGSILLHVHTASKMDDFRNTKMLMYPSHLSDAFNKREQAEEGRFIRQKEMERCVPRTICLSCASTDQSFRSLRKLKEKLQQNRKHLDELDNHIEELQKQQGGGEQH